MDSKEHDVLIKWPIHEEETTFTVPTEPLSCTQLSPQLTELEGEIDKAAGTAGNSISEHQPCARHLLGIVNALVTKKKTALFCRKLTVYWRGEIFND